MKNANGKEVIIRIFCTVLRMSISGFTLANTSKANVAKRINRDQSKRCFLLGFGLPSSVNMLSTNTAESTEVTKKPINKTIVVPFNTLAIG